MTFWQWWTKNRMDEVHGIDFTHSEEVWKIARQELLKQQRQRKTKKRRR